MARQPPLTLIPIRFPVVRPGEELVQVISNALTDEGLKLRRGDILVVASKIVSTCERRLVKLSDLPITPRVARLANESEMDRRLCAAVVKEADQIVGGVKGFLLTMKSGILTPNAGVDLKNSPPGTATLWPIDPDLSARQLRQRLERRHKTVIGVVIVDSHVTALRLGTVGLAIGISGFVAVEDNRGVRDIFGRPIKVTQSNLADDLASAAHLLMGESVERVGAVLIRGSNLKMCSVGNGNRAKLPSNKCLIGSSLRKKVSSTAYDC